MTFKGNAFFNYYMSTVQPATEEPQWSLDVPTPWISFCTMLGWLMAPVALGCVGYLVVTG